MSDDMKKMMALMEAMNAKLTSLTEEVAALKKQPKTPAKEEQKPDTSFAALYGALLTNADGSGKKFKHSADTKDGGEDDWFGVWDAKHKVVKRVNEDGSETDDVCDTFGDFGTAHYKSLGENNKKKLTHDSNGGWDKVKVYDIVKRKFFSANTLLPMGEKPRSQSRAKSASRRSNAAAAAGGGAELAIAKPKNSRRKPQASPKVMEAAQNAALAAAVPAAAVAAIKAQKEEEKNDIITQCDFDDNGDKCWNFSESGWVAVCDYDIATEHQRKLIERHAEFDGWETKCEECLVSEKNCRCE